MKKVIYIIPLLLWATTMAQTITINGTPMLVSDDISFPFWLESGSSISPEIPVSSISVLEFNIVPNNNGNDMVFNQVISVTEGQTVPEGKTWKVESILLENIGFNYTQNNDLSVINNREYQSIHETGLHLKFYQPEYISFNSNVFLYADILPGGGSQVNYAGFCYSLSNSAPDLNDESTYNNGGGSIGGRFTDNLPVGYNLLPDTTYYFRAFVSNDDGITYSNTIQYSTPHFYIGMPYQGGTIFYIDSTNSHGYILADEVLYDQIDLNCYSNETSYNWGAGITNTQILIEIGCDNNLQNVIDTFDPTYDDWFIPSWGELYYLCTLGRPLNGNSYSFSSLMGSPYNFIFDGISYSSFYNKPEEFETLFGLANISNSSDFFSSNLNGSYSTMEAGNCNGNSVYSNYNYNVILFREF